MSRSAGSPSFVRQPDAEVACSRAGSSGKTGNPDIGGWHESFRGIEVIARPLGFYFLEFERQGVPTERLLTDIALTREQLTDRQGRIDWETFRIFMRNVGRVWNDEELVEAGKRMAGSKWIRPFALVARLLFTADDLYRWNFRPLTGGSAQFFTCIENALHEHGNGRIAVDTWMAPGYEPAPELYRMFQGALIQMPRILGLGPAAAQMYENPDGSVRYEVAYPTGGGLLAGLRRAVVWPFVARSTARELQHASDHLFQRYGELARQTRELAAETAARRESDRRFQHTFNAAPTAMLVATFAGRILDVNDSFVDVTGYRRDEIMGRNTAEFGFWKDRADREQLIAAIVNSEPVRGHEVELLTRDGGTRIVLLSAERTELAGETCIIWSAVDITARKKAEEENLRLQESIIQAQKLESLGVMAGGVAHDFNNLLVGLLGNAELLQVELGDRSPVIRERIEAIALAGERAADLTRQMLTCAGRTGSSREPIELTALVSETATLLRSGMPKTVTLDYRLDTQPLWIDGDPTQISQVVMNLMTNAAESFGDARGRVIVRTQVLDASKEFFRDSYLDDELPAGRYAMIEVSDSGVGMDSDTQKRMFDPFFSTKFAGRGLGLAATLGIVRSHRGTLKVHSELSSGTCFQVYFPLSDERPESEHSESPLLSAEGVVLVVDDEAVVRKVTQNMLEQIGYRAIGADGGESALAVLRERGASLVAVVLDLTMPGMSGDETFREIRRLAPELPVLCCSGHGDEAGARWLRNKRYVGFMAKPFRLRSLQKALADLQDADAVTRPRETAEPTEAQ